MSQHKRVINSPYSDTELRVFRFLNSENKKVTDNVLLGPVIARMFRIGHMDATREQRRAAKAEFFSTLCGNAIQRVDHVVHPQA